MLESLPPLLASSLWGCAKAQKNFNFLTYPWEWYIDMKKKHDMIKCVMITFINNPFASAVNEHQDYEKKWRW
jgi:hypothetical protein